MESALQSATKNQSAFQGWFITFAKNLLGTKKLVHRLLPYSPKALEPHFRREQ
jgi:hypothetical protein